VGDGAGGQVMKKNGKRAEIEAVAYLRTSSASDVGADKDSDKRQRAAIEAFAKANGYTIAPEDWFYDAAVKGSDPVTSRPGFSAMLDRIAGNGVRTILSITWTPSFLMSDVSTFPSATAWVASAMRCSRRTARLFLIPLRLPVVPLTPIAIPFGCVLHPSGDL
jgi:Resolvase, N terminal domain